MSLPDFQSMILPVLKCFKDDQEHNSPELQERIAKELKISKEDQSILLDSRPVSKFKNRIAWCIVYLRRAKAITTVSKGVYKITQRGQSILAEQPEKIDVKYLLKFDEFAEFRKKKKLKKTTVFKVDIDEETGLPPDEQIEKSYKEKNESLALDLLEKLQTVSPAFFERLVLELIVNMGYGGSVEEAGEAVGGPGDHGIDGIIKQDKLGLDRIYLQAKKWDKKNRIGRVELQKFSGALQEHHARKGIFITTSVFGPNAYKFVEKIDSKIVLIDGKMLVDLMISYNLGVSISKTYEIKELDNDYFEE